MIIDSMRLFRECTNKNCLFRYPETSSQENVDYCPICGEQSIIAEIVNDSIIDTQKRRISINKYSILPVLDNIRSAYNVGSILRTCEGLGVSRIALCGITPDPRVQKVVKTSLGAENSVQWQKETNCVIFINSLRNNGYQIISLETDKSAKSIGEISKYDISHKIALVIGNEKHGIDPGVLKLSDLILSIPMYGQKESLNVAITFGISLFHLSNLISN